MSKTEALNATAVTNVTTPGNATTSGNATTTDSTTTQPSTTASPERLDVILGSTLGSVTALLIILLVVFAIWRRHRRKNKKPPPQLPPANPWPPHEPASDNIHNDADSNTTYYESASSLAALAKSLNHNQTSPSSHKQLQRPESTNSSEAPEDYLKPIKDTWRVREPVIHSPPPRAVEDGRVSYIFMREPTRPMSMSPPSPELTPHSQNWGMIQKPLPPPCKGIPGYVNIPEKKSKSSEFHTKSSFSSDDDEQENYENVEAFSKSLPANSSHPSQMKNGSIVPEGSPGINIISASNVSRESLVYKNIPNDPQVSDSARSPEKLEDKIHDTSDDENPRGSYVNVDNYSKKDSSAEPENHGKDLPQVSTLDQRFKNSKGGPVTKTKPKPPNILPKTKRTAQLGSASKSQPSDINSKTQPSDINSKPQADGINSKTSNSNQVTKSRDKKVPTLPKSTSASSKPNPTNNSTEPNMRFLATTHTNPPSSKPVNDTSKTPTKLRNQDKDTNDDPKKAVSQAAQEDESEALYVNTKPPPRPKLSSQSVTDVNHHEVTSGANKPARPLIAGRSEPKLSAAQTQHNSESDQIGNVTLVELKSKLRKVGYNGNT